MKIDDLEVGKEGSGVLTGGFVLRIRGERLVEGVRSPDGWQLEKISGDQDGQAAEGSICAARNERLQLFFQLAEEGGQQKGNFVDDEKAQPIGVVF